MLKKIRARIGALVSSVWNVAKDAACRLAHLTPSQAIEWVEDHAPTICVASAGGTAFGIYQRWLAPDDRLQVVGYFVGAICFLVFWWSLWKTAESGRLF